MGKALWPWRRLRRWPHGGRADAGYRGASVHPHLAAGARGGHRSRRGEAHQGPQRRIPQCRNGRPPVCRMQVPSCGRCSQKATRTRSRPAPRQAFQHEPSHQDQRRSLPPRNARWARRQDRGRDGCGRSALEPSDQTPGAVEQRATPEDEEVGGSRRVLRWQARHSHRSGVGMGRVTASRMARTVEAARSTLSPTWRKSSTT